MSPKHELLFCIQDINLTKPEAAIDSYDALDSVEENDDGFDNYEDVFKFNTLDGLEGEKDTVTPGVPFDEALIATVGGIDGITVDNLSRKLSSAHLEEMATSGRLEPTS
ncbi:unnamed protein product [Phytophthora fragariaefolia]|uniref:Unnamed protein product n=1 Tax=Phytophthora fragariaefolia TaxID=1490495 RepID=A0A9W6WVD0_9STRA|nr:unnamed protein product [Phytophthora fragariaefolia]